MIFYVGTALPRGRPSPKGPILSLVINGFYSLGSLFSGADLASQFHLLGVNEIRNAISISIFYAYSRSYLLPFFCLFFFF